MLPKDSGPILIVDDDEEFLLFLKTALDGAGYQTTAAASAAEASRELARRDFALILTDLRLAPASGIDLIKAARRRHPLAVGMIISAHGGVSAALEALREGAYDFLLKPCPSEVLLAAVARALEHHRLNQDLLDKTAQLERVEGQLKNKSRLLHDVSHEFRNPLSVVCGYSSLLLSGEPQSLPPRELARNLRSIHHNAARLNSMVEDLLDSARLAGGKVRLNPRPVDIPRLVAESVEDHGFMAAQRGLRLTADCPAGRELAVNADYDKVYQVLANLIGNAMKFTPDGGSVAVSAAAEGGGVRLCVRDTGPGLSADDAARVFERFYQAEGGRAAQRGLGLGLAICRELVELHGGRIWVETEPARGCAFFFTLPGDGDVPCFSCETPPAEGK
ncbi:MAG: ATP-binding protein [Elusimicrobia bacterium]|nr:ATP-binding protein [Elusimicrobiota bacterium]